MRVGEYGVETGVFSASSFNGFYKEEEQGAFSVTLVPGFERPFHSLCFLIRGILWSMTV